MSMEAEGRPYVEDSSLIRGPSPLGAPVVGSFDSGGGLFKGPLFDGMWHVVGMFSGPGPGAFLRADGFDGR